MCACTGSRPRREVAGRLGYRMHPERETRNCQRIVANTFRRRLEGNPVPIHLAPLLVADLPRAQLQGVDEIERVAWHSPRPWMEGRSFNLERPRKLENFAEGRGRHARSRKSNDLLTRCTTSLSHHPGRRSYRYNTEGLSGRWNCCVALVSSAGVGVVMSILGVMRTIRKLARLSNKQFLVPYYWIPYQLSPTGRAWPPLAVSLELTYLCNLRCRMCSLVRGNVVTRRGQRGLPELREANGILRPELSTSECLGLIRQMRALGVRSVTLTGGKPLLRPDILQLSAAIKRAGLGLSIISNGTVLRPGVISSLVELGVDSVSVSIDGTRAVHDRIRGVPGSFNRAMSAVAELLAERKRRQRRHPVLAVTCTISAMNQDDLVNLLDLLQGLDIDLLSFGYVHFSSEQLQRGTDEVLGDSGRHLKLALLDPEVLAVDTVALAPQVRLIRERASQNRQRVRFVPDLSADEMSSYFSGHPYTYAKRCFFPWFSMRVDPWGDVYPCWLDVRMGNVREAPLREIWNGAAYRQFRIEVRRRGLLPKCSTCCVLNEKLWSRLPGPLLMRGRLAHREAQPGSPVA